MKKMMVLICFILSVCIVSFSADQERKDDVNSTTPLSLLFPKNEATNNPPFIHWVPLKNAYSYKIKVQSPDKNIEFSTQYNFYTPKESFDVSDKPYLITVFAFDKDNKMIGQPKGREIYIKKKPLPAPADLNNISFEKDKPVLFTPEKIVEIKKAQNNEMAKYRDTLLAAADEEPFPKIKELEEPPRYKGGVWELQQWTNINNTAFAIKEYVLTQTMAYKITGNVKYFNNAKNVMLKVTKWDPSGSTGLYDDDHAAQSILYAFSVAYNLLKYDFSDSERETIKKCIIQRAEDVYSFLNPFGVKPSIIGGFKDPTNNHPWFCTEALGYAGMALMGEDQRAKEWLSFSAQIFWGLYLSFGGKDGDWHEGIDYWSYTLFFVFHFCDGLKTSAGIDFYSHPWLNNTSFFKIYTHPPVGCYMPFGDCKHKFANAFDKLVMMRLASQFNDELAWRYVDSIKNQITKGYMLDALLWSDRKEKTEPKVKEIPFAINYEDSGWVVSNSDIFTTDSQVIFAFRCGKVYGNGGHSHPDQNNFILTAGADKLIWDAGYYDSYGTPHHSNFTATSQAHNIILVDGVGQKRREPGADGILKECVIDKNKVFVKGDASNPKIYDGKVKTFERNINYENKKDLTVKDNIELTNPGNISWLLNSAYPVKFDKDKKTILIKGKNYSAVGTFITDEELEVSYRDKFPDAPKRDKYNAYPEEYTIEIKTKNKITKWTPELKVTIQKNN